MERGRSCRRCCLVTVEESCQEGVQRRGREEGAVDEDGEERRIRSQIVQEVVAGIKEKVGVHNGDKEAVQRLAGQSVMRSWDCSQIENEEEEESWREGDQMAAQWDGEQKLEEIVERRRTEGSSLKLEVMQKVPEPVVQECMSQGKRVKGLKEKKSTRMVYRRDEGKKQILFWWKTREK